MNETLRGMWTRVVDRWKSVSPNMRRNAIVIAVAVVAALSAMLWVVSRPHYVMVMSGLDDKSLGQVQTQLQTLKIPNEIQGTSVLVPSKDANQARVQLAEAGLPQSGYIGYSSVSNSLGMTQDEFNIQVLDALQQSLNETISSINGVESAQVHIVMPQQQLFVSQPTTDAKASVFVTLGNGVQLSATQVAGIQQLVAHSVTGLSVDNVSVVDQYGNTLSSSSSAANTAVGGASSELAMRQSVENDMTQKLTSGLQQIVGPDNAVVVVHANVTFNQTQSQSHVLQNAPNSTNGFVTSQQVNKSQSTNGTQAGGPAGQAGSNPNSTSSYSASSSSTGNSTSTQTNTTTNYDYSYQNSTTTDDPMQIQGYSVGVLLNSNDKAITPAEVKQIKSFVTNLVGQSATTQAANTVSVSSVPFTPAQNTTLASTASNFKLYGILALIAALLGVGFFLWRRRRQSAQMTDIEAHVKDAYDAELEELPPTEDELLMNQLMGMARQRPDDFASLLRTWLSE
ncbi:flagellar basal-body MS-ring/collar protein FliF [Alicyclobacillus fastidiosus]|uniref:Flagellar M-ring protein n=1 Tax=Alicyclobacillus fastidiosus TaxID=392011 RepID=A0ABV5AGS5_9BACL|nr:flagellar basal-body MS-ring/collar protein FliF [Alicyclobacillus fastidiosus]WEH07929.1 flagellar basal-body MS-ring/collar protein FliF [Alicyclobacillus fastidiosus]